MFRSSIKLFKLFDIEIRLDYSWFIIFALFAYYFGFSYFPSVLPGTNAGAIALITIVTVVLFFASVLIHEMSHSLVARSKGTPVEKITLLTNGKISTSARRHLESSVIYIRLKAYLGICLTHKRILGLFSLI